MESVKSTEEECKKGMAYESCYLPQHAAIKENRTSTKHRVVFDASRKTEKGKSFDDILLSGPTPQSDIVSILIHWRFHRIAFATDVRLMYRLLIDEFDTNFQRVLIILPVKKNQSARINSSDQLFMDNTG